MSYPVSRVLRFVSLAAAVGVVSAFGVPRAKQGPPSPGMSFKLKVTLRHTPTSGRARRATTLLGHGVFAGGMGRVVIDTVDVPSAHI